MNLQSPMPIFLLKRISTSPCKNTSAERMHYERVCGIARSTPASKKRSLVLKFSMSFEKERESFASFWVREKTNARYRADSTLCKYCLSFCHTFFDLCFFPTNSCKRNKMNTLKSFAPQFVPTTDIYHIRMIFNNCFCKVFLDLILLIFLFVSYVISKKFDSGKLYISSLMKLSLITLSAYALYRAFWLSLLYFSLV